MAALSSDQVAEFKDRGYILIPQALTPEELAALRGKLAGWIAESSRQIVSYGECIDGRPRFDLETGHTAEVPKLRRINNPAEISEDYRRVAFESRIADIAAALIGPNMKFHHCKINLKQPGSATRVGYHQDFSYTPHSNLDIAEVLVLLDDMTPKNGCLKVVPGSHKEGQVSLWRAERFAGEIDPERAAALDQVAEPVVGRAGDVCVMHSLMLHGSDANQTQAARTFFICAYTAADAVPLAPSPLPNRFEGAIVRGKLSRTARVEEMTVELPSAWQDASFFGVQGKKAASDKAA